MATKDSDPATKADLKAGLAGLDRKIDTSIQRLDEKIDRVALQVVNNQAKIEEMMSSLAMATKDDASRILNAIDAFAGKARNYDRSAVLHGQALVEVEAQLKDHENRIKRIESAGH